MKLWQVWDTLFPTCLTASQAETRARRTYKPSQKLGEATVTRYKYGWWVRFAEYGSPRFVHRGSGVVYYPTTTIPPRKLTEDYFSDFHSSRRVWCLCFPHSRVESEVLEATLQAICSGSRQFLPRNKSDSHGVVHLPRQYLRGPWIRGSGAAMEWLARELDMQGVSSERKRFSRNVARQTKLFRISHFQMPLQEALADNGRMWHGVAPECLFEEADDL